MLEAANAAAQRTLLNVEDGADVTDAANVGASIHGATAKTTPVDADALPLIDSAASNGLKKVTWANVKATLKTYFDTLYSTFTNPMSASGDIIYGGTAGVGTRLAKGTNGKVLTLTSGLPAWETPSAGGTISTPRVYYVETSGNDTTGDGTMALPYLTAQKAFDIAYAATGEQAIKLGVTNANFGAVTLTAGQTWPSRIRLHGVSASGSVISLVTGPGVALNINGNGSVTILETINDGSSGGEGASGGDSAQVRYTALTSGPISATGGQGGMGTFGGDDPGGNGGNGGNGGAIILSNVEIIGSSLLNVASGSGGSGGSGSPNGSDGSAGAEGVVELDLVNAPAFIQPVGAASTTIGRSYIPTGITFTDRGGNAIP